MGGFGGPAGTTTFEGLDFGPVPIPLVAVTVNVYLVPSVSPCIVAGLEGDDDVAAPTMR